jgi:hypothetical protein
MVVLVVVASFLIGINVGRLIAKNNAQVAVSPNSQSTIVQASPFPSTTPLSSSAILVKECGISFEADKTNFTINQASGAATVTNKKTQEKISIACAGEIPRPPLPEERMEKIYIDGNQYTLYHDASAKDGTPIDAVIFNHPTRKIDIGIFGFGEDFTQLLTTIRILQ